MRNSAPRERRDHATLLPFAGAVVAVVLAALAAGFSALEAAAQSEPCTTIQDDAERLACYDRALRGAPPAQPAPAPAAQTPASPPAQTTAPAPAAPPPAQTTAPAPAQTAAPAPTSPSQPAPSTAAAPAQQTPASREPQRDADEATIAIVVVSVRALPGRETMFTTQDGATWVQTDSQRIVGLPDTPFDAEIRPGAMSSEFLVPKGGSRAIRVRLVQR
jgi:hypothetical protein